MKNEKVDDLIREVQNGSEEAFIKLYEIYYRQAFFIALKISNCEADAYDAAQETFIEIRRSIGNLRDVKFFKLWFNRIVVSKCSNIFRKNKDVVIPDHHALFTTTQKEERVYLLPEANLHHASDKEVLDAFIKCLDMRYREVLILYYFSNLNMKEVADIMQIPEGTAKSRMNTAKQQLRSMVKEYEQKEDVKLNFRVSNIGTAMSALYLSEALGSSSLAVSGVSKISRLSSFFGGGVAKIALVSILSVATGGSAYAFYQAYVENQEKDHQKKESMLAMNQEDTHAFPKVVFGDVTYTTAYDAYYALRSFAHCKEEMESMSKEELKDFYSLYEAMKEYKGVYWDLLVQKGWVDSYESSIL